MQSIYLQFTPGFQWELLRSKRRRSANSPQPQQRSADSSACKASFWSSAFLLTYSSLASSLHLWVRSPVRSWPQTDSVLWLRLHLHLAVWLSVSARRRAADHYHYQVLFPQQNDISAFDPMPKLISAHFGHCIPQIALTQDTKSSMAKKYPLFF